MSQERDTLYGLAQSHLICQNAIDSLVIQVGQPVHALQLVCLESPSEHVRLRHLPFTVQYWCGQTEFFINCVVEEEEEEEEREGGREGERERESENIFSIVGMKLVRICIHDSCRSEDDGSGCKGPWPPLVLFRSNDCFCDNRIHTT